MAQKTSVAESKGSIKLLGSGIGYLYIVLSDGDIIISNLANTAQSKRLILMDAVGGGALPHEKGIYSGSYRKYYLNATSSARPGSLAGAIEITQYVTGFTLNNNMPFGEGIANNSDKAIVYSRYSSIQRLSVDTRAERAADDVVYIQEANGYVADGDILIIYGTASDRLVTIVDGEAESGARAKAAVGTNDALTDDGTVILDDNTNYTTGDYNSFLMLIYLNNKWHELNRAPGKVVTDKGIRDNDIPLPIKGTKVISTITAGASSTPQAGVTEGTTLVTGTHDIGSGNFTINKPSGGTPKEGERMLVLWNANLTTSGAVNVFGQTLTTDQMLYGTTKPMEIITRYANGAWQDGVISRSDDASEDALGNPSSNGMILSSTTAGVRSWVKREKAIHTVSATYDTASMAKAVSDTPVVISVDAFPKGALIMCDEAIIEMETALTSGGAADVSIGVNGGGISQDIDAIHNATDFNAAPFNSATAVTRTSPGGSVTILKPASGTCNIEVDVTSADLTGGKFTVTVPYMTS